MQCKCRTERIAKENATATARCVAAIENERTTKMERELFIDHYCTFVFDNMIINLIMCTNFLYKLRSRAIVGFFFNS